MSNRYSDVISMLGPGPQLLRRLAAMRAIERGWLGGGEGARADPAAISAASEVVGRLMAEIGLPMPRVYPTVQGGISVGWPYNRRPGPTITIEFDPSGAGELLVRHNGQHRFIDAAEVSATDREQLRAVVSAGGSW